MRAKQLWPSLKNARGARVVSLSSRGHRVYCEDVDIAEGVPADFPEERGVRPWAVDPDLAERLWKMSEEWAGVTL